MNTREDVDPGSLFLKDEFIILDVAQFAQKCRNYNSIFLIKGAPHCDAAWLFIARAFSKKSKKKLADLWGPRRVEHGETAYCYFNEFSRFRRLVLEEIYDIIFITCTHTRD